jgi:dTDP-L-rhamnose 4-epimerase
MERMDNILITGGAGFIGSHLADLLVAKNKNVTVIDSLEPQVHSSFPEYLNKKARYYFDRLDSHRVNYASVLADVDTVYYFASKVGPNQSMTDIADYTDCNIGNLGYFLQQLLSYGKKIGRIILSGSMGPYGEGRYRCDSCQCDFYPSGRRIEFEYRCPRCGERAKNVALDESTEIHNISYYGLSKKVQEEMLMLFAQSYDINFVSLRYFSVYGPRQAFNNPYAGPIPIWTSNALRGEDMIVYEDGNQTRDFIFVKDITKINYEAGLFDMSEKVEIINCGTGISTKIIDVARYIKKKLRSDSRIVTTGTIREGDLRHSLADNSKLRRLLKYDNITNIYDGLSVLLAPLK